MSIWQGSTTPRRTSVPFWRAAKLGGARRLAGSSRCCSVIGPGAPHAIRHSQLMKRLSLAVMIALAVVGCGGSKPKVSYVPGTKIPYSEANDAVLKRCEQYRN